jgi:hypothetical protein
MNYNQPVYLNIQKENILIDSNLIAISAGYPKDSVPDYFLEITNNELSTSLQNVDIKAGYLIIDPKNFVLYNNGFNINKVFFDTGKIIANHLKNSEGIIIFAASVGTYFDIEIKNAFDCGDSIRGLIIDTIGSEMVEFIGNIIEDFLTKKFENSGIYLSNRLSPGYCEWNVGEQKKLFNLLPKDFCGIKLNEAFMMSPIKSISGIIGYGKNVTRKEYACKICGIEYCYKRKLLYS